MLLFQVLGIFHFNQRGESIRPWYQDLNLNPCILFLNSGWAATAALDNGVNYGALLCTFRSKGDPFSAKCKMMDTDGTIWDRFKIKTQAHVGALDVLKSTEPSRHGFVETTLNQWDIATINTELNNVHCGSAILEFTTTYSPELVHTLRFSIDVSHLLNHTITDLRLQVMGSHPDETFTNRFNTSKDARAAFSKPKLSVSLFRTEPTLSCGLFGDSSAVFTNPHYRIQWDDEFEIGEVWVSPKLTPLLDTLKVTTSKIDITLGIKGESIFSLYSETILDHSGYRRGFYGFHPTLKSCLSPTLVLVTER